LLPGATERVLRVAAQLERSLPKSSVTAHRAGSEALDRALLAAFPDRVSRRRPTDPERAVMVGGSGLLFGRDTAVRTHDLFLALEVQAGRRGAHSEGRVHLAVALQPEWLAGVLEAEEAEIDTNGRVRVLRRRRYRDLVIEETEIPIRDRAVVEAALIEAASRDLERHLALGDSNVADFLARLRSLAHWRPELELPTFDEEALKALLPSLVLGARALSDLSRAPLLDILRGSLDPAHYRLLNEQAPTHVELPRGRTKKLQYEPGRPPVLAARIQEFFGMQETPTVGGGRIKVLLHLLAPNFRPQQVTDDLVGFWKNTYPEVRKELRGRYPKHDWPEDPSRE
ncbi:MAG: ATP-dependent helicase HrpB, partial [Thermoanaerobaculia bacterium]|nr:ATP-dependent helicase HrpB [Thermoanaerobaculia bacterium]